MAERLSPEGKLDLAAVDALVAQLRGVAGKDVTVDLAAVTSLGALCTQAFLAAARDARGAGRRMVFCNATEHVTGQMAAMGFTPETLAEGSI